MIRRFSKRFRIIPLTIMTLAAIILLFEFDSWFGVWVIAFSLLLDGLVYAIQVPILATKGWRQLVWWDRTFPYRHSCWTNFTFRKYNTARLERATFQEAWEYEYYLKEEQSK